MSIEKDMMVNYAAVDLLSEEINKHHQGIEASMDTLTGKLDLMESGWDGEDRETYAMRRREWDQRELEMRSALRQFNIEVLNAKLGYQGAEIQNRRIMDNVEIPKA